MTSDNLTNSKESKAKLDYLKELLIDRTVLSNYPDIFLQVAKILEKEILCTRSALLSMYGIYTISDSDLPEPAGQKVNLQFKVYMPADSSSSFNFVGRILGPDGSTAKCLQQCLGVKIMVRGRGSMRDRKKEEANIGRPNWEHLNDKLHVVLTVEDFENRAKARLSKASDYITLFLKESMKGSDREDKVKQMQLMELSFQRDQRLNWTLDCNNLLDPGKTGLPMYYGLTNLLNFPYPAYPPASLFSAIQAPSPQQQHGSPLGGRSAHHSHTRHYYSSPPGGGQTSGQSTIQQQHPQVNHFTPLSPCGSHLAGGGSGASGVHSSHHHQLVAAAAALSAGGLAFPPASALSAGHLGSTTLLLGPANSQGGHHHPGAYSPPVGVESGQTSVAVGAPSLPPGAMTVTPMSYWPPGSAPQGAPAFSQLTAAAAALDYHHHPNLHHQHAHQMHHPAAGPDQINHLQQAAGYSPYVPGAHMHPMAYQSEIVASTSAQEYSPGSADGHLAQLPGSKSSKTVGSTVDDMNSMLPALQSADGVESTPAATSNASAVEEISNANSVTSVTSEDGNDSKSMVSQIRIGVTRESDSGLETEEANHSGLYVPLGELIGSAGSVSNSGNTNTAAIMQKAGINGRKQAASTKHSGVGKPRYSQKHHSQFNAHRNNSQQQLPHSVLLPQQQQDQSGRTIGRSEIATVRVGSCEVSGVPKPLHLTSVTGSKGESTTIVKQKVLSPGTTDVLGGTNLPSAKREARGAGRTVTVTAVGSKKPTQPILLTNEADWPRLGTDAKVSKSSAVTDNQIDQDLLNLSISGSAAKAI